MGTSSYRHKLKIYMLFIVRGLGGFFIAKLITRQNLRILCYHGISATHEHEFNGLLFMRSETFRTRMTYLESKGFQVLPLSSALAMMKTNSLPSYSVVITIDDGWHYTYTKTVPILRDFDFPATIYVTSYYAASDVSVLNVVVRYLIWRAGNITIDLRTLSSDFNESFSINSGNKEELLKKVLAYIETLPVLENRKSAVIRFADCLGFDGDTILDDKVFQLMTVEEIKQASVDGVDIQLHTHRHRFPSSDPTALIDEIETNRAVLEPFVGTSLNHLCYPSGEYSSQSYQVLQQLGIESAVTCESGFATSHSNVLALPRFLDGEDIAPIEFEAEMSGVLEIMRRMRTLVRSCL